MRLIVASNSAPRWRDGVGLEPRSPGGLVPLLAGLLAEHGGDWVCTVPPDEPAGSAEPVRLPGGITIHQVFERPEVLVEHYLTVGVRLMLWLFHYLFDTSATPSFDAGFARAFRAYEQVNRAHADRLRTLASGPDDVLLVNDYHLFLVPEMLRGEGLRHEGRILYFHGLPWCEPAYFGILPPALRDRILTSLLHCDVVGFHDSRWAQAFIACCERYLPGCRTDADTVRLDGRTTRVTVAPFPLDTSVLDAMRTDPRTVDWQTRLGELAAGRRVLARADRLDLWKNQVRGFAAYGALLEEQPDIAKDWWFCAVATRPTRGTERSDAHRQQCEAIVEQLNNKYGTPDRPAISLIYPDAASTRNCAVAALSSASATLVNPTIDGMNLVSKEALYLAPDAPSVLSVNAGSYEELAPYVIGVQPYDVLATADALRTAMALDGAGPAPRQRAAVLSTLAGRGPAGWLSRLLGA
ncbi:trehalose-6-phosphate synthase [Amycolatopsis sp. GM8]|uniref:trehalose-6-phosphate synthase n=1 Tax=Amycolatopsis sp. GM8 TaxID=2896530 RepID=UPI001F02E005|nr:trehalose-6-phosphate synthase [Amycolatopsis sp. GM8]